MHGSSLSMYDSVGLSVIVCQFMSFLAVCDFMCKCMSLVSVCSCGSAWVLYLCDCMYLSVHGS